MILRAHALALALFAFGAFAQSPEADPELAPVKLSFEYGRYDEVQQRAKDRIDRGNLPEPLLIELHKYAGLAAYNLGRKGDAERHFIALIRLDPDYGLDPFVVPPPAIEFYESVRKKFGQSLEQLREQKLLRAEREKQDRIERDRAQKLAEEQRRRIEELSSRITVRTVKQQSLLLNFLPFGAGQFQQGRYGFGVLLAATEGALAATSIVAFLAYNGLVEQRFVRSANGLTVPEVGIFRSNKPQAERWNRVKWISGAAFYATYVLGVTEALIRHQDEVVTTEIVEIKPGQVPTHTPTPSSGPKSELPSLELSPYAVPLPGGLAAGLTLRF